MAYMYDIIIQSEALGYIYDNICLTVVGIHLSLSAEENVTNVHWPCMEIFCEMIRTECTPVCSTVCCTLDSFPKNFPMLESQCILERSSLSDKSTSMRHEAFIIFPQQTP